MLPHMDPAKREHFIYRCYNANGELLYLGCTNRPRLRWYEHRGTSPWTQFVAHKSMSGPYSYSKARELEHAALAAENPLYGKTPNKRGKSFFQQFKCGAGYLPVRVSGHPTARIALPKNALHVGLNPEPQTLCI